ncbi:E3 ubiquitin-protein ligase XBOS34 [Phytophthora cinnamomi]|uniref:E3 ubiquitin-protein ligase XBOS34 n=1 Tax=Phytophthora cinnamomi TaxID=4785 RepID=UPI0035595153|nr:E3 ubiquitin-protein ligase XBOS34 [Phytophthora cinnamomi]
MAKDREELALWRAAKSCNAKKLLQLVSNESDDDVQALLNQPHPVKGTTPLMVAATKKYGAETIRALIQLDADLDAADTGKHRNTALHFAAYNNRIAQLELLLNAGANPFVLNRKGHTALDVARLRGRKEAAAALTSRLQVHSGWLHLRSKSLLGFWKRRWDGDDAKLQQMLVDSPDDLGPNLVNWFHHRRGTTPLMVAAESKRGEAVVRKLIGAGAEVNAEDETKLKNTALHYAAMASRDSLVVNALLEAGADAFALNRKGLSPLDLARQYRRAEVAAALMEHMKVHSGWIFLRGKFRWKKHWGVVVACNKQHTSKELCIFHKPGELRPDAVLLVDEAARASPFPSSDSFCWLKRDNAFIFDKPVLCQRVKRQKLTRSPICRKTMSQEDVQTRDLAFAADSLHNLERWQEVLQSSNFYARDSGTPVVDMPPFDAPHGELYYWPHELVQNVRSSMLRQQEQQGVDSNPLFRRLGRALEQQEPDPAHHNEEEVPLEDMLRDLQGSNNVGGRPGQVRCAPSEPPKSVEVVQPAQQAPPNEGDSSNQHSSDVNAASSPEEANAQQDDEDLCGLCCSQRRNAVCAPCGHRAGCHACLRTVMHTSHACPFCRARVRSIMRVYD